MHPSTAAVAVPVRDGAGAISVVGQEELPDAVLILECPVVVAWCPVVELAHQRKSLGACRGTVQVLLVLLLLSWIILKRENGNLGVSCVCGSVLC